MKNFIILLLLIFTYFNTIANEKLIKKEHEIDELIELGFFEKAKKKNQKFIDELLEEKLENYQEYLGVSYLHLAQIDAIVIRDEHVFKEDIHKGLAILQATNEQGQTKGWLRAAEIYLKRGNTLKSSNYLMKITQQVTFDKLAPHLQREYYHLQALTFLASKGFQKALHYTNVLYGSLEYSKVNYSNDQVHLLLLKAKILIDKGDYFEGDSILNMVELVLVKLPSKSPHHIDYLFLKALFHDALDNAEQTISYLEEAFFKLQKIEYALGYAKTCYTYEELVEYLCLTHWSYKNEKEGDDILIAYEKSMQNHFENKEFVAEQMQFLITKKYIIQTNFEKAEKQLNQYLIPFLEEKGNDVCHAKILELKYIIETGLHQLNKAENSLTEYLKLLSKVHPTYSTITHYKKLELAYFYVDYMPNFEKALTIFESSYTYQEQVLDYQSFEEEFSVSHYDHIYFKTELASLYFYKNHFEKAETLYQEVIELVEKYYGEKYLIYPIQHMKIADFYLQIGNYEEALFHLRKAEKILKNRFQTSPEYPACLQKIVHYFLEINAYHQAKEQLYEAQKVYASLKIEIEDEQIIDFATLYIQRGQYSKVEKVLVKKQQDLLQNYQETDIRLVPIYYKLAELYLVQGLFFQAESFILKGIKITKETNQTLYTKGLALHGKMYMELENYQQAQGKYLQILAIYEKDLLTKERIEYAYVLQEYVKASLFEEGVTPENQAKLLEATSLISGKLGNKSISYLKISEDMALYFLQKGNLNTAHFFLEKSKKIWKGLASDSRSLIDEADFLMLQGEFFKQNQQYQEAINYFEKSVNIYKTIFNPEHPKFLHAEAQIGKLYYILGNSSKAIAVFHEIIDSYLHYIQLNFKMLSEQEKNDFWKHTKTDFEFFYTLAFNNYQENSTLLDDVYHVLINTKGVLLNSSMKIRQDILNGDDEVLKDILNQWIEKREIYLLTEGKTNEELSKEGISKYRIQEELNHLEKQLSRHSNFFVKKLPHWKDVKHLLQANEVAVEIIRYRHYTTTFSDSIIYAALIIDHHEHKHPKVVFLPNGRELETKYYYYYSNVIKETLPDEHSYQQYWKPIQDVIGERKTIYLSVEGIYNRLNIETLQIQGEDYVIDKNEIISIGNTKDILHPKKTHFRTHQTAVLVGNPTFYSNNNEIEQSFVPTVRSLEGAKEEVLLVERILHQRKWDVKVYLQDQASEDNLKNIQSPTVLHIATHGFFYPTIQNGEFMEKKKGVNTDAMLNSGLLLKDGGYLIDKVKEEDYQQQQGILTAYEVMNLKLENTDLVVLSACETGLGDVKIGEGVYGLQRAFLIAGANSIIMSLFQVSDEITRELMQLFYAKWLITGNKRAAFLYAKEQIRKVHPDPLYWGSFVLIER